MHVCVSVSNGLRRDMFFSCCVFSFGIFHASVSRRICNGGWAGSSFCCQQAVLVSFWWWCQFFVLHVATSVLDMRRVVRTVLQCSGALVCCPEALRMVWHVWSLCLRIVAVSDVSAVVHQVIDPLAVQLMMAPLSAFVRRTVGFGVFVVCCCRVHCCFPCGS